MLGGASCTTWANGDVLDGVYMETKHVHCYLLGLINQCVSSFYIVCSFFIVLYYLMKVRERCHIFFLL